MNDGGALALYLGFGVIASLLLALGLLMMKSRAAVLPPALGAGVLRAIATWLRDPVWLGGLGVQAAGYALYVVALADAPVSLVAVMMQGGIALFVIFAAVFLNERASALEWAGIGGVLAAMVVLALSLSAGISGQRANDLAVAGLTAVALTVAAIPAAFRRLRWSGAAAAIASGIAFGLASVYTKGLADDFVTEPGIELIARLFADPWLYLASAANIGGLVLLQNSFAATRGIIAMPLSSVCSNIVPIIGGLVAFGERLPSDPNAAAMRVGAFVLTVAASGLLAAGPEA